MNLPAKREVARSPDVILLAGNDVTCELRCAGIDRGARIARYELAIENRSGGAAACRIVAVSPNGSARELGGAGVDGDGCGRSAISVPLKALRGRNRLEVELVGDDLHMTALAVPANEPPARRSGLHLGVALALCGASVAAIFSTPQQRTAAPRLTASLPSPSPAASRRPVPIVAVATVPRILSFGARRDDYGGAAAILASYEASADSGVLRVVDPAGRIVARAPFSKGGLTRVALPAGLPEEPLRAELDVERATAHALSWLEIPAAHTDPSPSPSPSPSLSGAAMLAGDGTTPSPVEVTGPVVPGQRFTVAVRQAVPHLRLTLQDAFGSVVEAQPVADGTSAVSLQAPADAARAKYYVVATFTRGATDEVAIRSLHVSQD